MAAENDLLTGRHPFHNSVPHIVPAPLNDPGSNPESYPSWVCVTTSVRTGPRLQGNLLPADRRKDGARLGSRPTCYTRGDA
jgi:hypothetical protein